MKRPVIWTAILVLGLVHPAFSHELESEVKLRNWYIGLQSVQTWRNSYDVFDRPDLPPGEVTDPALGGGIFMGRRFGDRFLLGLQVLVAEHLMKDRSEEVLDLEAMVTGTVLFRPSSLVQPFLRGGMGLSGENLVYDTTEDHVFSFGMGVIAGGGVQLRLSSWLSIEFEAMATCTNFSTAVNGTPNNTFPDDSWKVKETAWGWRIGSGIVLWF